MRNAVTLYKLKQCITYDNQLRVSGVAQHHGTALVKQIHTHGKPVLKLNGRKQLGLPYTPLGEFTYIEREVGG